jgi:hypothetical protein
MNTDENIESALAGQVMSAWLPIGLIRKLVFFTLLLFSAIGIATESHWYHFLLIMIAAIMSPRLVGEIAYFFGKLSSVGKNK